MNFYNEVACVYLIKTFENELNFVVDFGSEASEKTFAMSLRPLIYIFNEVGRETYLGKLK